MPDTGNYGPTPGVGSTFTELGEVIALLARSEINTMMPAEVIAYRPPAGAPPNRTPAVVDVRPHFLYRRRIEVPGDAAEGETAIERTDGWHAQGAYPNFVSVPVAYAGHDGMRSSGPIKVGATGWLFFAQRSIDDWINTGGPVDPKFDYQWHHLSDSIFVPGARYGSIAEDIDPTLHRVGSADGAAGLEISDGEAATRTITVRTDGPTATVDAATKVKLGEGATLGVARLTDTTSADTSMTTWIAQAQVVLAGAAALLMLPVPVPPTDFGVISSASTKVDAE